MPKRTMGVVKKIGPAAEMELHNRQWPAIIVVGNFNVPGGGTWFIRASSAKVMRGDDMLASWNDGIETPLRMIQVEEGDQLTVLNQGESSIAAQYALTTTGLSQAVVTGTPTWLKNGFVAVNLISRNGQPSMQASGWLPPINFFEGTWTDPETTALGTKTLAKDRIFTRVPMPYRRLGQFAAPQSVPRANAATYNFMPAAPGVKEIMFIASWFNGTSQRPIWLMIAIGVFGGTMSLAMAPIVAARGTITKALIIPVTTEENNPNVLIAVSLPDLTNANEQIALCMIDNTVQVASAVWNAAGCSFEGAPTDMSEYLGSKPAFT